MIPLASDLLVRFRWQMRRGGLLASASSPTGFRHFGRIGSVDPNIQGCPEVMAASVQRVSCRGKQATETTCCHASNCNVRFWHKADMLLELGDVCFWG